MTTTRLQRQRVTGILLACGLLLATCSVTQAQKVPAEASREILTKAQHSYYSLKQQGFSEMRCAVDPDWDAIFASVKADKVGMNEVLPLLKRMHFEVLVGPDGSSLVSHDFNSPPPTEKVAARIRSAANGFEEVVTGFFHTWSQFAVSPTLLQPDGGFTLTTNGDHYELVYSDPKTSISITMGRDYAISSLHMKTPELETTMYPKFSISAERRILSGYESTFQGGPLAGEQLFITIKYLIVDGLNVPGTVTALVKLPTGTMHMPFTLSTCRVKKR
jgi:hypothetical protein